MRSKKTKKKKQNKAKRKSEVSKVTFNDGSNEGAQYIDVEPGGCFSCVDEVEFKAVESKSQLVSFDENLLERARTQWQFGDWVSLIQLRRETLQHHPERAKLALLSAAGHMQSGSLDQARQYVRLALEWGCGSQLVSRILIAGVHNSLGRMAALNGEYPKAIEYFERAITIGTPGNDTRLFGEARLSEQVSQLGIPSVASNNLSLSHSRNSVPESKINQHSILQAETHYLAVLADLHDTLKPAFYLEIGVGRGQGLALARCEAIGIDPVDQERVLLGEDVEVITATSDEFFTYMADEYLTSTLELVFLGGMPLVDNVLRDFNEVESRATSKTLVLVPGVYPPTREQATRRRISQDWCGDIWKLPRILRRLRPDLRMLALDVKPAGLLMISGLDPDNRTLSEHAVDLDVDLYSLESPPFEITQRTDAVTPDDPRYIEFIQFHSSVTQR